MKEGVREEKAIPPAPRDRPTTNWWVLVAVGVGTFMSALDSSIVNALLPVLTRELHSTVATIEWVVTVYLLVVSGLLLSVGRWGDLHGPKRVYMAGFGLFVLGSVLCGMSPSAPVLVAFRGLQGVGAAMLFASSPAILTRNFPARRRGQVLGLQATMTYLGLTVGAPLGGWLTVHWSWRAVFAINVPVGMLALYLSWRFIPRDKPATDSRRFDVPGALAFIIGLVTLMLALNRGSDWGWGSPRTVGSLVAAAVVLAGFVAWEARIPEPMLDLSLFRRRVFSASSASALLNYVSLSCLLFVLPFYLIQGRGFHPDRTGLVLSAQPIVMAVAAPLSGLLSDRIGTRLPATVGMAILALGLAMLARLQPHSPTGYVVACLMVTGLGTGMFISPNNSALMGSAPRERQGIASGVLATARNMGMVLGVGLGGAIFTSALARHAIPHSRDALFHAVDASLATACGVACLGIVTCLVRGRLAPDG